MAQDDVVLGVGVDPSGAQAGSREAVRSLDEIRKAARETDEATKRTTRGFDGMGKATEDLSRALNNMRSVLYAVGLGFSAWKIFDIARDATTLAARLETLEVVMEAVGRNAGYSKAQVTEFAEDVRKMGITILESRNTIIQLLQAEVDLTQATKLARVAQDAAVIGNVNSSEALQRMIYGIKSAQVEILRTLGLNVSWERSYEQLANKIGKSAGSLSENEKMQARVNAVMEDGSRIVGTYEAAMSTANKILGSTARYSEDFRLKVGMLFLPTYREAVFAYAGALEYLNKAMDRLLTSGEFGSAQEKISQTFEKVVISIAKTADVLLPFFAAVGNGVNNLVDFYNALPEGVREFGILGFILLGTKGKVAVLAAGALYDAWIARVKEDLDFIERKTGKKITLPDFSPPKSEGVSLPKVAGGDSSFSFEAAARKFIEEGREKANTKADLPPGFGPTEKKRDDINTAQIEKSIKLMEEQARWQNAVASAMLVGEAAVQKANVAHKEAVFVQEKLNGSRQDAEELIQKYTAAVWEQISAEQRLAAVKFDVQQKIEQDKARALASAYRGGGGVLVRQAQIEEKVREEMRKEGIDPYGTTREARDRREELRNKITGTERQKDSAAGEQRLQQLRQEKDDLIDIHRLRFASGPERAGEIAYQQEMNRLKAEGSLLDVAAQSAIAQQAKEMATLKARYEDFAKVADDIAGAFTKGFEDAILGAKNLREALWGVAQDLQRIILRKAVLEPVGTAISGSIKSIFGFEEGGIMTAQGPVPLRKYAGGGVAYGPQMAMFGEGSVPEAYVPLPSGRIPVEIRGQTGGNEFNFNVTVNVQGGGQGGGLAPDDARRIGNEVANSLRGMVIEVLHEQSRPGNMMNPVF